ncbi:unnamed protein product [Phytomonas sp. Hart1]|nr:unnamed protein product [Phytomonas sp. Hart1]|eukprot:CCW68738.1 unnamed protein product [Phytomonas sp. isolate Hart1]
MSNPFYYELEKQQLEEPLNDIEAFLNCARYNDDGDINLLQDYLDRNPENIDSQDNQGRTAVHMAAANDHTKILEVLFQFNPRPDLANIEGNTALHFSALNNRVSAAKLLLRKGWKANVTNIFNRTPLHLIQGKGFEEMETVLLSHDLSLEETGNAIISTETEDEFDLQSNEIQEHNDNEEEEGNRARKSQTGEKLSGVGSTAGMTSSPGPIDVSKLPAPPPNSNSFLGSSNVDEVE